MPGAAVVAHTAVDRVQRAGWVCLAAGLIGAAAGISLALISPAVDAGGFTFPHGAPGPTGLQVVIALQRLGLIFGLFGLWWCGAVPPAGTARLGWYGAMIMTAVLTVTEGLAVTVSRLPLDGTPPAFGVIYGAYTSLFGVALLALGVGVARTGAWRGWKRWLPLTLGVWLLVLVLPALASSFEAARWATSAWLLLFALLGLVLTHEPGSAPRQPTPGNRSAMSSAKGAAVVTWAYVAAFGAPSVSTARKAPSLHC